MSKGFWNTTQSKVAEARNIKADNPEIERATLVKQLMEKCRIKYGVANKCVRHAEARYPRVFKSC